MCDAAAALWEPGVIAKCRLCVIAGAQDGPISDHQTSSLLPAGTGLLLRGNTHTHTHSLTHDPCGVSMVITCDPCLLGNDVDRNEVFLVSFSSRTRQMDGEPETSRPPQQRQQQAAGERADGVGDRGQGPARQEEVLCALLLHPPLC